MAPKTHVQTQFEPVEFNLVACQVLPSACLQQDKPLPQSPDWRMLVREKHEDCHTGPLPPSWGNLTSLYYYLGLQDNKLSGKTVSARSLSHTL